MFRNLLLGIHDHLWTIGTCFTFRINVTVRTHSLVRIFIMRLEPVVRV